MLFAVEELFGSLLRVLDDKRPTADAHVSDDDDEVVLWQARSLTAAEWKDGFAGTAPTHHFPNQH